MITGQIFDRALPSVQQPFVVSDGSMDTCKLCCIARCPYMAIHVSRTQASGSVFSCSPTQAPSMQVSGCSWDGTHAGNVAATLPMAA